MERIARKGLQQIRWQLERYQPFALSVYSRTHTAAQVGNGTIAHAERPARRRATGPDLHSHRRRPVCARRSCRTGRSLGSVRNCRQHTGTPGVAGVRWRRQGEFSLAAGRATAGFGPLDCLPQKPTHCAGDRQPNLAVAFGPAAGGQPQQFWRHGQTSLTPSIARLVGRSADPARLVAQRAASADHDVGNLSPRQQPS